MSTKTLRGGLGEGTGTIIINEEVPVRTAKPIEKPKAVDPRKVNTLTEDDEVKTATKTAPVTTEPEDGEVPKPRSRVRVKPAEKPEEAKVEAVAAPTPTVASVPAAVVSVPAPPPGFVQTLTPEDMQEAATYVIRKRVSQIATGVIVLIALLFTGAYFSGYITSAVLCGALTCSVVLGWPIKKLFIEPPLRAFLGVKVYLDIAATLVMTVLLLATGGIVWEWVASFAIISCMIQILVINVTAAQAQAAIIEIREEEAKA